MIDRTEKTILELFADADHDAQVLTMMLKSYTEDDKTLGLGIDKVIARSIIRAEREALEIKNRYEQEGER